MHYDYTKEQYIIRNGIIAIPIESSNPTITKQEVIELYYAETGDSKPDGSKNYIANLHPTFQLKIYNVGTYQEPCYRICYRGGKFYGIMIDAVTGKVYYKRKSFDIRSEL